MSYIYEALKKAEDEHKRGAVAVRPTGRRTLFGGRPPWWLWALIGVLGANVVALVALLATVGYRWPGAPVPDPASRDTTVATTRSAEVKAAPPARPAPPVAPAPAAPAPPAPVAPAPPVTSSAPIATARPATPVPPVAPPAAATAPSRVTPPGGVNTPPAPTAATPVPPARVGPSSPVASAPAARSETAARAVPPRAERQAAPAAESRATQQSPAKIASVPPETRATEGAGTGSGQAVEPPKVTLQVIVYSDVPSQRMVFIDGHRYSEGDAIDAETVLERINTHDAIFKRRGVRFVIAGRRD